MQGCQEVQDLSERTVRIGAKAQWRNGEKAEVKVKVKFKVKVKAKVKKKMDLPLSR